MAEHFIFQCVNFLLLLGGLIYLLRRPLREFLSGRKERLRSQIVRTRRLFDDSKKRNEDSRTKLARAGEDASNLKRSLAEIGMFKNTAIMKAARETAERIERDAGITASQEASRAEDILSMQTLERSFEEAEKKLAAGIAREDQRRLIDESLAKAQKIEAH